MKKFNVILILCLFSKVCIAQSYNSIFVDDKTEWDLSKKMFYFSTPTILTPKQAFFYFAKKQAIQLSVSQFKKGYDPNFFWFYLKLKNNGTQKTVVLSFNRADIHHLNCFAKRANQIDTLAITGDALPFSKRPILVNDYAVPIALVPNEEVQIILLIDKRNEFIEGRFGLYELNQFYTLKRYTFGIFCSYLGITTFLIIFNLFLWFSLKDNIHLLFIAQLLSSSMFLSASTGFINEFSPIDMPYRTSTITVTMVLFWSSFNFFFINSFLKLNPSNSRFYKFCKWLGQINLVVALLFVIGIFAMRYPLDSNFLRNLLLFLEVLYVLDILIFVGVLIEQNLKKNPMVKLYSLAILVLITGFLLTTIHRNSSLNIYQYSTILAKNFGWVIIGVLFEQVTLAFGLTIRYNILSRKNADLEINLSKVKNEISKKVIQAQETERQRLAKDLHDDLGGTLSVIKGKIANEKVSQEAINLVEQAIDDLRYISRNLSPPELENDGLIISIKNTIDKVQNVSNIKFAFITFGEKQRLDQDTKLNIYRIITELINNILKHSNAQQAIIQFIYYKDSLQILVEDDGVGIKSDKNNWGIGLKNITSRVEFLGAKLEIDSSDKGTTVIIELPIKSKK